jgi:transglutaminase-like putative cysteine protease
MRPILRRLRAAALLAAITTVPPWPAAADSAGLFSGRRVVVLSGLPGDLESESEYRRQTASLLEAIAAAEPPADGVTVLDHAGALADRPAGLAAETRRNGRDEVVAVARRLAAAGEPVTLVAWGHGGLAGDQPVFHVRGPRVTPEDLAPFAVPGSTLILLFPGSGRFAERLRAGGVEVLSSEAGTVFRSDPVAIDLLTAILRRDPALDLPAAAAELGREVHAWYEERGLARTEEPTLWSGGGEPVRLARAAAIAAVDPGATQPGEASRVATAAPGAATLPESPRSASTSPPPASTLPTPASATSPPAWEALEPAAPGDHPGADAVILRRALTYTLAESPAVEVMSEDFIQVLTSEGARAFDFELAYSPPEEELEVLDCELRRPDGAIERVEPSEVRAAPAPAAPGYTLPATVRVSLPGAEPGAVLRLRLRRAWRRFPLPHPVLEVPLGDRHPIRELTVEVRVPAGSPLHHAAVAGDGAAAAPERASTAYADVYRWRLADRPARIAEPLTAPGGGPRLLVSTFPDWPAYTDWYRRLVREAGRVTPEIAARARELTAGARTDRERAAALYDFVTGLRYVAVPLGVSSHRPHAAADVLADRYGDCKDKANLLNALLAAVGIEADLVLVPRFADTHPAVPGAAFNHAISRIRLDDGVVWVDATDEIARFGLLPPGDPNRRVLIVREGEDGLTRLPAPVPADHRLEIAAEIALPVSGDGPAAARLEARAEGFADYRLRRAARVAAAGVPLLEHGLRPHAGAFGLVRQEHPPAGALDRAFAWSAEGSWSGLTAPLPGAAGGAAARRWLLHVPFWLPAEWSLALAERSAPLFLNEGYPLALAETVRVRLPAAARRAELPPDRSGGAGPLAWSLAWERAAAPGGLIVTGRFEAELATGELTIAESESFQRGLPALYAALAAGVVYGTDDRD